MGKRRDRKDREYQEDKALKSYKKRVKGDDGYAPSEMDKEGLDKMKLGQKEYQKEQKSIANIQQKMPNWLNKMPGGGSSVSGMAQKLVPGMPPKTPGLQSTTPPPVSPAPSVAGTTAKGMSPATGMQIPQNNFLGSGPSPADAANALTFKKKTKFY